MAIIPWDDLFFHISEREKKLKASYDTYVHLRETIMLSGELYTKQLRVYQEMSVWNASLMITYTQADMTDVQYTNWIKSERTNEIPAPDSIRSPVVLEILQGVDELIGPAVGGKIMTASISKISNTITNADFKKVFSNMISAFENNSELGIEDLTTEQVAQIMDNFDDLPDAFDEAGIAVFDAEEGLTIDVEVGAEAATEASLASLAETITGFTLGALGLGVGILVLGAAIGMDVVLGTIKGCVEDGEIKKAKKLMDSTLAVINTYNNKLEQGLVEVKAAILKQQQDFLLNLKVLNKIQKAHFDYNYEPGIDNIAYFRTAMKMAMLQYTYLYQIRSTWELAKCNKNDLSWNDFKMFMQMQKPKELTKIQVDEFLEYAKNHSDSMKNESVPLTCNV